MEDNSIVEEAAEALPSMVINGTSNKVSMVIKYILSLTSWIYFSNSTLDQFYLRATVRVYDQSETAPHCQIVLSKAI